MVSARWGPSAQQQSREVKEEHPLDMRMKIMEVIRKFKEQLMCGTSSSLELAKRVHRHIDVDVATRVG